MVHTVRMDPDRALDNIDYMLEKRARAMAVRAIARLDPNYVEPTPKPEPTIGNVIDNFVDVLRDIAETFWKGYRG